MLKNDLLLTFRLLRKSPVFTTINVAGLSVGLACFTLLLLHVTDDFTFDRFHERADRIYRVYRYEQPQGAQPANAAIAMPMPLGPAMLEEFPDVVNYVRFRDGWGQPFVRTARGVIRHEVEFADPQVFSMFSFPLLYGDPATALRELNSVVLTEKTARALFGEANPTGRTLDIKLEEAFEPFVVTAVAKDLPSNSTIRFGILANFEKAARTKRGQRSVGAWNRSSFPTFVELRPGSGLASDSARLQQFFNSHHPNTEKRLREEGRWTGAGAPVTYRLQPLRAMHTDVAVTGGSVPAVDPKYGWILLGLGAMILLIACINFTTLAIGRSAGRAREIGVRRVVGAYRGQLVRQFLAESLLLSGGSMAAAMGLVWVLLPELNALTGKDLRFDPGQFPELVWMLAGLTVLTGLLAGSYPALVLSGFRPLEVLQRRFRVAGSNSFTRGLVTFQFVLSVGLIACTLTMVRQLDYLRTKNPGYDKANVLVVNAEGTDTERVWPLFRAALAGQPAIGGLASSEISFGADEGWSLSGFTWQGTEKHTYEYFVDPAFIPVLGMELLAGRNFRGDLASDTVTSIIINESFARDFGWTPEQALGQPLTGYSDEKTPVVIGVVRDFNYSSLHDAVKPMLFHMYHDYQPLRFLVRLQPGGYEAGIGAARTAWQQLVPELPFTYSFLDDNLARFYVEEAKWSRLVGYAGVLAILLACLGLFGLAALAAINRTKEVGIRKVLGASVAQIAALLTADFMRLVALAVVVATPLAWYAMRTWLDGFAYRIELGWTLFGLAALLAAAIAAFTVGLQSVRAAVADPVRSLRNE